MKKLLCKKVSLLLLGVGLSVCMIVAMDTEVLNYKKERKARLDNNRIILFNLSTSKLITVLQDKSLPIGRAHKENIRSILLSKDGHIISRSRSRIKKWNIVTGALIDRISFLTGELITDELIS